MAPGDRGRRFYRQRGFAERIQLAAFDAYLFDIDGTLLNSRDAVHYEAFLNRDAGALRARGWVGTVSRCMAAPIR